MTLQGEYEIIRSSRKTLALQLGRDGRVVVRAPRRVSAGRIQDFVENHWDWVEKKRRELQQKSALPECTPGEEAFYRQQAARILPERVAYFAAQMGVTYGRITIRGQKTRWGSCSSKGNLSFNWRLMLCPPDIQDYIVVHELAHRKEMNHSGKFYLEVEKVLPDYRERQRWLKTVL